MDGLGPSITRMMLPYGGATIRHLPNRTIHPRRFHGWSSPHRTTFVVAYLYLVVGGLWSVNNNRRPPLMDIYLYRRPTPQASHIVSILEISKLYILVFEQEDKYLHISVCKVEYSSQRCVGRMSRISGAPYCSTLLQVLVLYSI